MNKIAQVDLGSQFNSPLGVTRGFGDLLSLALSSALVIAGIIAIFFFVFGGLQIITSAGNNDPKAAAAGKQAVTYAVIGFLIILSTYWILTAFEVISGVPFITAPGFVPSGGGGV